MSTTFLALFRLFSYLLTGASFAGLMATSELNPAYIGLGLAGLAGSLLKERLPLASYISARAWTGITILFVFIAILDVFFLSASIIVALAHFLIYLMVNKLFNLQSDRDYYELYCISFFQLLIASVLTISFSYALFFLAYQVLAVFTLILFHFKKEGAQVDAQKLAIIVDKPFFITVLSSVALTLVLSLFIFFIVPRLGMAFFQLQIKGPLLVSGFSDRVELGAFGEIIRDPSVALRVKPSGLSEARLLSSSFKWRGPTYDRYDGAAWHRELKTTWPLLKNRYGVFTLPFGPEALRVEGEESPLNTTLLKQEVYMGDLATRVLFGAEKLVRISADIPVLNQDAAGSVFVPYQHGWKSKYVAYSQIRSGANNPPRIEPLSENMKERYLDLPPLSARVVELAKEATRGAKTNYEKATRLDEYLRTIYKYSLDIERHEGVNPLEDFLFVSKSGHCEYFATSYAILARALGLPTRLVTGFVRGEWNEFGKYFLVRQEDAHAWVEVYFPERGWVSFDPTPRPPYYARPDYLFFGTISRYLDSMKLKWQRFIVDFSAADQVSIIKDVRQRSLTLRADFNWRLKRARLALSLLAQHLGPWARVIAGLLLALAAIIYLARRRGIPSYRDAPTTPALKFYARLLKLLARYGWRRNPSATPWEFALSLNEEEVKTITQMYYGVRYGGKKLSSQDQEKIKTAFNDLKARLRPGRRIRI